MEGILKATREKQLIKYKGYSTKLTAVFSSEIMERDFLGGTVVKNLPANARDTGSSPGPGRSHMLQSN